MSERPTLIEEFAAEHPKEWALAKHQVASDHIWAVRCCLGLSPEECADVPTRQCTGAAPAVLFLHGRPHFHRIDGSRGAANSGAPICLVGYGIEAVDRLRNCGLAGSLVTVSADGGEWND